MEAMLTRARRTAKAQNSSSFQMAGPRFRRDPRRFVHTFFIIPTASQNTLTDRCISTSRVRYLASSNGGDEYPPPAILLDIQTFHHVHVRLPIDGQIVRSCGFWLA